MAHAICLVGLGGQAVILDSSYEEKIESDPRVVFEKENQATDKQHVQTIADWTTV